MKTIDIYCTGCGLPVTKELKEVTRQRKNGNYKFYCNSKCFGLSNVKLVRSEYRFCEFCNNLFLTDYTTDTRHCSRGCASANSVTDYRREKAREIGLNAINGNLLKGREISVVALGLRTREMWKYVEIEALLNKNYLEHQFEYPLERYVYDLALYWDRILIEFDSMYHNGNSQIQIDKEKELLANSYNWRVVRIQTDYNNVIPGQVILPYL